MPSVREAHHLALRIFPSLSQPLAQRFRSFPGLLVGDVGVTNGGLDVLVAEQLLDLPQILADVIE